MATTLAYGYLFHTTYYFYEDIVMKRHTDMFIFPLILLLAAAAYALHKIVGVLLDEWIKNTLEALLGQTLTEFITRFADTIIPMLVLAFILFAMYRYIVRDIERAEELKESEQLKISFDPLDPICVQPNVPVNVHRGPGLPTSPMYRATFYRLKIRVGGESDVNDCQAFITSIRQNGVDLIKGETLSLPFSNLPPTSVKRILDGIPDSVDFLSVTNNDDVMVATLSTPGSIDFSTLFKTAGDCEITLVVSAPGKTGRTQRVIFHWTGSHKTSYVSPA